MKKNYLPAAAILTTVFLTGCATSSEIEAKRAEFKRTIPTCSGTKDCNAKWEAAQLWVVHNAGWKVQNQSSALIETYDAVNSHRDDRHSDRSTAISIRVTKEPLGQGRYQLLAYVWCDNSFGCTPDEWDAALAFNRAIGKVSP